MKSRKKALIIGATGLVGRHCLSELLKSEVYSEVTSLSRKPISTENEKHSNFVVDFEHLKDYAPLFDCDDLFLCLGTTIKSAGSKERFYQVDHDINFTSAKLAQTKGAKQCILVSAVGADKHSSIFYNKVKGQLEDSLAQLDFWALHLLRPSILLGDRQEKRFLESIGQGIGKVLNTFGSAYLGPYQPVKAEKVASFMLEVAQRTKKGKFIYESDMINSKNDYESEVRN